MYGNKNVASCVCFLFAVRVCTPHPDTAPAFLRLDVLGGNAGTAGAEAIFPPAFQREYRSLLPNVSALEMLRFLWRFENG